MKVIINKYGKKIVVGQKCIITKQFSNLRKTTVVTKVSSRFVYANGQKFCINNLCTGRVGSVSYIDLLD